MADDNHTAPETTTAGQLLQQAREQAQLSVADVAARLNLRPVVIEALEADDNDNLPSSTFVRGYLGSYARLLGIPESNVLEAYQGQTEQAQMQSFSNRTSTERSDNRVMWLTYLIVLVLIGFLVVWWWQKQQNGQLNNNAIPANEVEQAADVMQQTAEDESVSSWPSSAVDGDEASQESDASELAVVAGDADLAEPQAEIEPVEDADSSAAAEVLDEVERSLDEQFSADVTEQMTEEQLPASEPADVAQVRFMLSKDCWMRVEDATGEVVVEGVKTPSRVVEFSGVPPFHAIFGVPDAVTIEYQGETYPFEVDNPLKTLRLTFPAE
ncbi:DUF4115 domain-containing protein [Neiella sp. HB171785]|uniref:DUF4115 domain-containing protein n=1 Tax=Neiella litorisoli TaxID=2771431 RepID=A0A8J6QK84_9GAMM|nr:RodZ domain-containing protein [Neiella litorisoli]MBD1390803.1 DUF4115 domain-containing protein [Neiella litorisoli]